ncbi:hypothetical protein AGDE_02860 [Angomonas deanei]|uniref:Uncharacterized protein n=1 Tax=Angomonas deanei TaxID=59799 RepID=A0A7G2CEE6_9TRYP|nr:hypothetical protein AGDE_02860 [Angomonas deanei]CAD2218230.1 hypothetical protein, conserved [Angomonas deanei]|eukprot:EPY41065.1 hypothetical protein AGDE_02860 [Angomonas deanei]
MGENTGDITPNDESGDSFHILVEFSDALSGEASRTLVRCVGSVLCDFTKQNVNEGDLVHVLGSLSVLPNTHYGAVVCVLPIGGDISVLVPS